MNDNDTKSVVQMYLLLCVKRVAVNHESVKQMLDVGPRTTLTERCRDSDSKQA